MTEEQLLDTKEKILQAARELFSTKGFEGASVREIATMAGVNIAGVNYHFSTKENLFWQVMDQVFQETSSAITKRREELPFEDVSNFGVWIFRYFLDRADVLRSVFKMMLSDMGWADDHHCPEEKFGPPGGIAIAEAIIQELKHDVPEEDMFWAVKVIFSHVVHTSLMYSNHFCDLPVEDNPYHTQPVIEKDIKRLVKVVLRDLSKK